MARKKIIRTVPDANARHLWLAGLGLVAMAGRGTAAAATRTVERVGEARQQAAAAVEQAQTALVETAAGLRERIEAGVAQAGLKLEGALAPLVAKFKPGKTKRVARRGRKPAAKKTARRGSKQPAARRARKA